MPNLDDVYQDKFLRAHHLDGESVVYTISRVTITEFKGDPTKGEKPKKQLVLEFEEDEKQLGLNKTNASVIGDLYGRDTDDWIGEIVVLYPTQVPYGQQMVDAIRVNAAGTKKRNLEKQKAAKKQQAGPRLDKNGVQTYTQAELDAEIGPEPTSDQDIPF